MTMHLPDLPPHAQSGAVEPDDPHLAPLIESLPPEVLAYIRERERAHLALNTALRDTAAALTSTLDPERVMERILQNVGRVVPHDAANIILLEGGGARIAHFDGYPDSYLAEADSPFNPVDLPNFQAMLRTGSPCLIPDTLCDPNWRLVDGLTWIRSFVSIPIRVYGLVIGFLTLDSAQPNAFNADHVESLHIFADQMAIAIENAQLYDALRRDAKELRILHRATSFLFSPQSFTNASVAEVATQIVQAVVREFGQLDCGVMLLDEDGRSLQRLARAGDLGLSVRHILSIDGPGLVPEAVRTGKVIYAPDVTLDPRYFVGDMRTRSELVIPLMGTAGVLGVLDLQSPEEDHFEAQEQRMLVVFAERAATALENAMLYARIRQYALDLERRVEERTEELRSALAREQELNQLKSRFISTVSHEFRTPLAMIMTASDLLKTYHERLSADQRIGKLDQIQAEVATMTGLLDELLTVSRAQAGRVEVERESVALVSLCEDVLTEARLGFGSRHTLHFKVQGALPSTVLLDPKLIRRLLFNLLTNAVKYSLPEQLISLTLIGSPESVSILVQDQGMGIPPEDQARLFEPFHRARNAQNIAGTGLGLAIVKHIVDLHGGTITLHSELNAGTTFTVVLPLVTTLAEQGSVD